MSKIDELRRKNSNIADGSLEKTTVVVEDVKEIEGFYGINESESESQPEVDTVPHIYEAPQNAGKKRGVGRPKLRADNEIYSQIHINLPESLKIRAQQAITCRRMNMNAYIVALIEKDMKENGEEYESLYKSLAKFS